MRITAIGRPSRDRCCRDRCDAIFRLHGEGKSVCILVVQGRDLRCVECGVVQGDGVQCPVELVAFVGVDVGAKRDRRRIGPKHRSGFKGGLNVQFTVDEDLHVRAIERGDEMMPSSRSRSGIGEEIGDPLVAVAANHAEEEVIWSE